NLSRFIGRYKDAIRAAREQTREVGLAHGERQGAQVLAIERQDVEGVELHLIVVLARVQRLEVGDAVDTEHYGLTIDDELPDTVLQRGFDDPRIVVGPVVTASCDQAHAIAVTLQVESVAVVLYFMEPARAVRNAGRLGRKTKLKHRLKTGIGLQRCESVQNYAGAWAAAPAWPDA